MKHIVALTQKVPARAAMWQEMVCYSNQAFVEMLSAKGGNLPFLSVVEGKCDLPES